MTYSEKLRDPRWQKKRLEIMARDLFECQLCHSKDKTLNVHHRHYLTGREPWDYPNEILVTLCEVCHKKEEEVALTATEVLNTLHFWGYFNIDIVTVFNEMIEVKIQEKKTAYAESNVKGLDKV